jgi:hypothetical protein
MNTASSNPPSVRASQRESARAGASALDVLERLSRRHAAVRVARVGSGIYRLDEFAGLENLDRAELDETDEDAG